ncbi:TonB-dependent receptor [Marinicauda pacifica]|nr:TonB-dependent receptor [Marinicauda pacifica]
MHLTRFTAPIGICLLFSASALAQEEQIGEDSVSAASAVPAVTTSEAIVQYRRSFFDQFTPVTAADMVTRLPGFSLSGGDTDRRGLADAFGNLLINGRRPSDKSQELHDILDRIPAGDVERIELVREAVAEFDMRGHGQLANVILRAGAGRSINWSARALYQTRSHRVVPHGEIFLTDRFGEVEVTVGLEGYWNGPEFRQDKTVFNGQGERLRFEDGIDQRRYYEYTPTASIATPVGADGRVRLDLRGEFSNWRRNFTTRVRSGLNPEEVIGLELFTTKELEREGSATLAYSHRLSDAVELQSTAFVRESAWDVGPERYEIYDAGGLKGADLLLLDGASGERALRQQISWTANANHSFDAALEGAFNFRETALDLFFDDGMSVSPVELPVSDTRVEEVRGEASLNHVWSMGTAYSLESGLRYEVSEISQSGDAVQERQFRFLKPSMAFIWTPDGVTRWRLAGLRDVDQLEFSKFASSVNLTDDVAVLGNPDYRPENTWTLEAEWERRFGDDATVSVVVGRDWVQDLDDYIPVVTPRGVFDAPGNIGDGIRNRVTLDWSSNLALFGMSNAVLDGFVEWYDTHVDDPLTGEDRPFSDTAEWELSFDFRQTFPEAQWAWGWDYYWLSDRSIYRARELREEVFTKGDLDVYVETSRFRGLTARLGADFIIEDPSQRERIIYARSRSAGPVALIERRDFTEGARVYIQLRGTL